MYEPASIHSNKGGFLSTLLTGCGSWNDGTSADNQEPGWQECFFHVEIIEDPPKDAPVVSAEEKQLFEVAIIRRIFEKATDPDKDHGTAIGQKGEYEQFTVNPKSAEEFEEGEEVLDSLPDYENLDYPAGVYIYFDNYQIVAVIAIGCET
ncbi:hypothetical protein [Halosolutus gelatinilyticus]|uniref:hypothetical protein n=1 Tax=Halosolutus gelatinilyticus TaxID=2931975 RepID=UPI001FF67C7A|nr:hypothetical protein [Halosolutus gelatinilyticus]